MEKKIILYGNKKIKNDFKYLFKELSIFQDDIDDKEYFERKNLKEYFIVICEKQRDFFKEKELKKRGLEYNKDYMYIKDFFIYYNPLFLKRGRRKLVVWGIGVAGIELWDVFEKNGFTSEIDFFVDKSRDQPFFKGKKVVSPIEIKGRKDIYVIVASYKYQWEIYEQLKEYGFQEGKDYIHCSMVNIGYQEMLEKVCFAEAKYPYICERPFGYCDVIEDKLYLCCPDFLPVSSGSIWAEPFMASWDSLVARILRLSVCNGTFVFCKKEYCDRFDFREYDEKKKRTDYKKENLEYPKTLMIGIDHSCNLKCPSCRKEISIAKSDVRKEIDRRAEDLLENVIPYVGRLWIAGNGEVFCSPTYKDILKDARCKKRKSISILSNGTLFDKSNWKLLDGVYPVIEIVISMDGIKDDTIEKLREGANAKKLKKNLEFLGRQRKEGKIDKLFVNCVIQVANVGEIRGLLEYCEGIGVDKVQFLKLSDHGTFGANGFDKESIFDRNDCLKKEYEHYFTEDILMHPLADWFNIADILGGKKKLRLDEYDTM